jgi:hypothetical protein
MIPGDFLTRSVVTGLGVALGRGDSFPHQPSARERVSYI